MICLFLGFIKYTVQSTDIYRYVTPYLLWNLLGRIKPKMAWITLWSFNFKMYSTALHYLKYTFLKKTNFCILSWLNGNKICYYTIMSCLLQFLVLQTRVVEKYFSGHQLTPDNIRSTQQSLQHGLEFARVCMVRQYKIDIAIITTWARICQGMYGQIV